MLLYSAQAPRNTRRLRSQFCIFRFYIPILAAFSIRLPPSLFYMPRPCGNRLSPVSAPCPYRPWCGRWWLSHFERLPPGCSYILRDPSPFGKRLCAHGAPQAACRFLSRHTYIRASSYFRQSLSFYSTSRHI